MIRLYIAAGVALAVLFSYAAGIRFGRTDCARQATQHATTTTTNIITTQRKINATTNNTDMHNIRHILHEKYTIAD